MDMLCGVLQAADVMDGLCWRYGCRDLHFSGAKCDNRIGVEILLSCSVKQ